MDREFTKTEKHRRIYKNIFKGAVIVSLSVTFLIVTIIFLRPSVSLDNLVLSTVDVGELEVTISASGKLVPAYEEIINSPINSRILEVTAKVGDTVQEGNALLKLDLQSVKTAYGKMEDEKQMMLLQLEKFKTDTRNHLSEMEMRLKVSRMELGIKATAWKNECYLDSIGAGTTERIKQVELIFRTATLQLEQDELKYENEIENSGIELKIKELELNNFCKTMYEAQRTLEDAGIRAPRNAILTEINSTIGAQVSAGQKVAVVANLTEFKVVGEIADSYRNQISCGSRALVKIGNEKLDGVVSEVAPLSKNGVIGFTVQLTDEKNDVLRSGLKSDIYIFSTKKTQVKRISVGSYYRGRGEYDFFVKEDSKFLRKKVLLGDCNYQWVEVCEGLKKGDMVIVGDMSRYINENELNIK